MKARACTVYLPHLNYTVVFRPFKKPPRKIENAKAWTRRDSSYKSTVYFSKSETPSQLAHEIVHVLHFICCDRHMQFEQEFEHMAYMMQYLMGRVLGYSWATE